MIPTTLAYTAAALLIQITVAQKFDPYQLNGGLVAAVAGKDYVLIASDTRLTDGGYGINSRRYLSGRIWSASSSSSPLSSSTSSSDVGSDSSPSTSSSSLTKKTLPWKRYPAQWESDGSLVMPSNNDSLESSGSSEPPTITQKEPVAFVTTSSQLLNHQFHPSSKINNNFPVMIGSAGCASDCESLKRRVRLELDALECSFSAGSSFFGVQSVANLLQQILYGRRGFPFYSFCVVAGIDQEENNNGSGGAGAVYVYDAIGSYERVAVASSGTGRELLQPILDRLFSEASQNSAENRLESPDEMRRDGMAVPAGHQRVGVAGSLRPPVQTTVNCSWEEAVNNVARAYRSVAEREISVGDEIVICLVNTSSSDNGRNGGPAVDVFSYPLKKH